MVGFGILVEGVLVRVPYKVTLLGKEDLSPDEQRAGFIWPYLFEKVGPLIF